MEFPRVVDNTMLNEFRSCPQKAYRSFFQHWKPQGESVHLVAGAAFARGLEVARKLYFDEGAHPEHCIEQGLGALIKAYGNFECPADSAKSAERMAQAFEYYLSGEWSLDRDKAKPARMPSGKHAIEFSFAEPLPIDHPETGEPIIYAGRSDMICELNNGLYVEDDKTTKGIGPKWANDWEMRSQFTGYAWAANRHGWKVDGVLVRGVAILKTEFKRAQHISYRPEWEIDRWLNETYKTIRRMITAWRNSDFDYNMGESCAAYGGCSFLDICKKPNPEEWLPMYFAKRRWDPLTRTEEELA